VEPLSRSSKQGRDPAVAVFQSTFRQLLLRAMSGKPALVPVVVGAWSRHEKALVEHAGRLRARLPEVIDSHLTSRHDQLEPALWIGEDADILQRVPIDHKQIGVSSRCHHAHLPFHPQ
jgi:hypothetical protein